MNGIPIINSHVPQGYAVDSEKYTLKLVWFRRLQRYFESSLSPDRPAIWLGDLNVAPEPIDVYHPDQRVNDPDFHIDARTAYKEAVAWGFVDVFRKLHPDVIQYTYWDYYRNAVQRNFGWRIDHILATAPLNAIRGAGASMQDSLDADTLLVGMLPAVVPTIQALPWVEEVTPYRPAMKLSHRLQRDTPHVLSADALTNTPEPAGDPEDVQQVEILHV